VPCKPSTPTSLLFEEKPETLHVIMAKPKVLSISYPEWAGEDYMKEFKADFDLHVSQV
jgi:hypothetical protein